MGKLHMAGAAVAALVQPEWRRLDPSAHGAVGVDAQCPGPSTVVMRQFSLRCPKYWGRHMARFVNTVLLQSERLGIDLAIPSAGGLLPTIEAH